MSAPGQQPTVRPVAYKGEPLDAERGPGLGCFRFQVVLLGVLVVLTPLSVTWNWPAEASVALLVVTILLLLLAGQTIIFLLRLVAADRRAGRRRPLASATPTVGELEDAARLAAAGPAAAAPADAAGDGAPSPGAPSPDGLPGPSGPGAPGVRE